MKRKILALTVTMALLICFTTLPANAVVENVEFASLESGYNNYWRETDSDFGETLTGVYRIMVLYQYSSASSSYIESLARIELGPNPDSNTYYCMIQNNVFSIGNRSLGQKQYYTGQVNIENNGVYYTPNLSQNTRVNITDSEITDYIKAYFIISNMPVEGNYPFHTEDSTAMINSIIKQKGFDFDLYE